jgi:hypothetical protein
MAERLSIALSAAPTFSRGWRCGPTSPVRVDLLDIAGIMFCVESFSKTLSVPWYFAVLLCNLRYNEILHVFRLRPFKGLLRDSAL